MQPEIDQTYIFESLADLRPEVTNHYNVHNSHVNVAVEHLNPKDFVADVKPFDRPNAHFETMHPNHEPFKFSAPTKAAANVFPKDYLEALMELVQCEDMSLAPPANTSPQRNYLVNWVVSASNDLKIPRNTVTIALTVANQYLDAAGSNACPDILALASASLLIATKATCRPEPSLEAISSRSNITQQVIQATEKAINNTLQWGFVIVTPHDFISLMRNYLFEPFNTSRESQAQKSLENVLVQEANLNLEIAHFLPSSVALACILIELVIFDPCGSNTCSPVDLLLLAQRLDLSVKEIGYCVRMFVDFLNETHADDWVRNANSSN